MGGVQEHSLWVPLPATVVGCIPDLGWEQSGGNSWRRLKLFAGFWRGQALCLPLRGHLGEILSGRHGGGEEAARWGRRWSPRDDNFFLPSHSLRRELDRGRCGGGAPAQGRAEGPTAQKSEKGMKRSEE